MFKTVQEGAKPSQAGKRVLRDISGWTRLGRENFCITVVSCVESNCMLL